ncbi:AAA family ATPase [Rhizobium leguminosarum]|nr:AAA family ATPase [Rhizobium leguminosarum]
MHLYAALRDQLDDDYLVLHSVAWIAKPKGEGPRDGEVDFLICHPRHGLLVIEVKGGRIDLDYAVKRWTSTDRLGIVHEIHNPFDQARRGKYGILEKLKENPLWQKLAVGRFAIGHAIFVPDVGDGGRLRGPDAPSEIIGDRNDLTALAPWVELAIQYWASQPGDNQHANVIGTRGVEAARKIFARVASTRPLLSARLEDEEQERITLTDRQAVILDYLARQRRVMVAGGAGTGKTLIAREKAVRAAEEGLSTLLVCFNRGLADHLREQCVGIANLEVASFHQLCRRWIDKARVDLGRDLIAEARHDYPDGNEYDHHQPIALALAIDLFGPHYDAIIVDEAQDFGDEFWMPIELMLSEHDKALLYVFLDENQDIYGRSAAIPIAGEPMLLDRNCRNTSRIHAAAYRYYKGTAIEAPAIAGVNVELIGATGIDKQARAIASLVTRLVAEEKVKPHEIGILLCDATVREVCERALTAMSIPAGAKFGRLEAFGSGSVTVDTVARFKGLERPIIILWGLDACTPAKDRETLYVGMSRAKSLLFLCGDKAACERLIGSGPA